MKRLDFPTLILVTIVTLLIWLLAEDLTRQESTLRSAGVAFAVADPDRFAVEPDRVEVTLSVGGSNRSVSTLREIVENETLTIGLDTKEGIVSIDDLAKRLNELPTVSKTGVKILSVQSPTRTIKITELAEITAPVRPRLPEGSLVQDPVVSQKEARIILPRREAAKLPENLTLEAVVDPKDMQHLEPGDAKTVDAIIKLPEEYASMQDVSIIPADARVSFRLVSRYSSVDLDKVYVQLLINAATADAFKITLLEPVLRNVQVETSTELAAQLAPGPNGEPPAARVVAVLPLSNLELEQGVESKPVAYFMAQLPDGTGQEVTASVDGEAHPLIQISVEAAAPPPTAPEAP